MSSLTSLVSSSAFAFTVPLEALAPILGIFVVMLGLVVAAGFARIWFARYKNEFANDDQMVVIQLTGFASVSLATVRDYPSATASSVASMLQLLMEQPAALFSLIFFFIVATVWNKQHNAIAAALIRVQQCDILPIINDVVLPIANFVRLIFDAVWPLVSLGTNYYAFATGGWYKVLRKCNVATNDTDALFNQIAVTAQALAAAIVTFFAGDIFADRLLLTNLLTQVGLFANFLLPIGNCFCAWLDPIWIFYTSIPQMQALHTAIEAAVNAVLRLLQIVLTAITEVEAPFWSTLFEELILLVISVGETAEQAAILVLDLLTDIINQIGILTANNPATVRTLFGLAQSFDLNGAPKPPTLRELYHAAANTKLSASKFASPPRELGAALRGPIWNIPNTTNVTDLLGFPVILALLQTPWSHAATELAAGGLIIVNMTLNIVSNPIAIFSTPTVAISYFQVGPVFDRLKAAWNAASQLLIIIDPNFPDAVSLLGQALATYWEALAELIIGAIAAIIWPTWSFGEPPPTDCSVPGSCGYPAPGSWTFFNIFPDYYDWQNNALRRALVLLEQDADAIAVLLGCNATSIGDDDCTAMPFQCAIRTAQLGAVEAVNQTLAFIFYLPDLAQFDYPLKTFQDLNPARLQELFYLFVECLTTWIELLDDEEIPCMTTNEPEAIPEPSDGSTLPTMPPLRADFDCALDSLAYYDDGRLVLVRPVGSLQDEIIQCDLGANSSGCSVRLTTNGNLFQIFGDPTRDDLLVTLKPTTGTQWFPVRVNTSTDYSVNFPVNSTTWASGYNISNIATSNCTSTAPLPLPDPLPLGWGCYAGQNASERIAVYRPLDSINRSSLGPVYLYTPDNDTDIETDELENLACTALPPVGYSCQDGPKYFGSRLGIMLPGPVFFPLYLGIFTELFPEFTICDDNASLLPKNTTCRNNRLYYQHDLDTEPKPLVPENNTQAIVPCFAVRPSDYTCSVNGTGPAMASNGTGPAKELIYDFNNTADRARTVPCIQNTGTVPPTCVRVDIDYASGVNATIEVSGVDVRVYINGVRQPTRCSSPSFNSVADIEENTTKAMVQVEQYFGVHVDAQAPALTFEQRMQIAKARARESLRTPMSMAGIPVNAMNVTLYPKDSFTCCAARTLNYAGRFYVAVAFEIIITVRSLLSLPAGIPLYVFEVPTFRDALEDLRGAVCELACAVTRIIPAEYRCTTFTVSIGCTSGPSCAKGLLCHIADAVLLLVEVLVEILETIRDLTNNDGHVPAGSPILGEECSPNNVGDCVASVIIYVITKVIFTVTQIARDLAANVDCLLCAISSASGANFCMPGLFAVINPITRLIEGLVDGVLAVIVKIGISVISLFVYLFSGDTTRFVSELSNIFDLIGEVITNFAEMVLKFFLALPGIKELVNFFNTIIAGACNFLEGAINAFAGNNPVDLNCPSESKKRTILATGWMPPLPDDVLSAMSTSCRAAVAECNATDTSILNDENSRELGVCYSSKYWLVDVPAMAAIDGYANDCDYRMPDILGQNVRWSQLTSEQRSKAFDCTRYRQGTIEVQKVMPFMPRDIADNTVARLPDFLEQMLFAYSTFNQYRQDRIYPASTVVGNDYTANWVDSGYNTAHLDTLRSFSVQDVQSMLDTDDDDAPGFLTIHSYAHRAVDLDRTAPRAMWQRARMRNPEQVADAMRFFNKWLGRPTSASAKRSGGTGNRAAHVVGQFIEFALNETARHRVLPPPSVNISDVVRGTSTTPHGYLLFTGLLVDVPSLVARAVLGARDANLAGRTYTAGATTAEVAYAGVIAAFGVVRDLFGGRHMAQSRAPNIAGVNGSALLPPRTIWRSTITGEQTTLTAAMRSLFASISNNIGHAFLGTGTRSEEVYRQFIRLATASPEAEMRRARLRALMAGARASLASSLVRGAPVAHVEDMELQAMLTAHGDISASNVTCSTNFTGLCEGCYYIDQFLGRLETGVQVTSIYYQGNETEEPSYACSRAQFESTRTYLNNRLAPVIIGDSPSNPVRWPWHDRSQWRIVGDPTPNKLRFSDLGGLMQNALDALLGDNTGDLTSLIGQDAAGVGVIGANVLSAIQASLPTRLPSVRTSAEASAPQDVLIGLFDYFYTWIKSCAYDEELNGTQKRFSIGESVLIIAGVAFTIALVVGQLLPMQMATYLGGVTVVVSGVVLFGTLVVAYSWSNTCMPALPQQLADDLMYFFTYTLFARVPWLFGGIIKNSSFTNEQAGICANYAPASKGGYEYAHCVNEVGFKDLGYVIAFILITTVPEIVEAINGTQAIMLRDIVQLEWVQERLNAFSAYNASDPVSFSIYNSCSYVYVLWSHLAVAQLYLRGFLILRPLIGLLASIIVSIFMLAAMAVLLILALIRYLFVIPIRVSAARARALRGTEKLHWRDAISTPLPSRWTTVVRQHFRGAHAYRIL